jgi:DNA repair protein RadA
MVELEDISGLGPKSSEKLRSAGIVDPEQLAIMREDELKDILGISRAKAGKIIQSAKTLAPPIKFKTASEVLEYRKKHVQFISTNSSALDKILYKFDKSPGGIQTDAITAFLGNFSSGKTQLCHQLVLNTLAQLKRKAAWIETEAQTFRPERLLEMAKAQGKKISLDDVIVVESQFVTNPVTLFRALEFIEEKIKSGVDIGIIVIDSYSAPFRGYYKGREQLTPRSMETARHALFMNKLASKYNIAIVLTVQTMGVPDSGQQLGVQMKQGIKHKVYGGSVLEHSATFWISLYQISATDNLWGACTFDCPLKRDTARFRIDETGIRD